MVILLPWNCIRKTNVYTKCYKILTLRFMLIWVCYQGVQMWIICAYNQVIGFRVKYSFHPNAWYSYWQSNLSKGLVSYPFCESIMAFNEKLLVPFCTHAVGSQLDDVGLSKLPPSLCREGPLNTIFDKIGVIPMKMES
jgi:hypothetical protein